MKYHKVPRSIHLWSFYRYYYYYSSINKIEKELKKKENVSLINILFLFWVKKEIPTYVHHLFSKNIFLTRLINFIKKTLSICLFDYANLWCQNMNVFWTIGKRWLINECNQIFELNEFFFVTILWINSY